MRKLIGRGVLRLHDYVPGMRGDELRRKYGLSRIIKMSSNESVFGVAPAVTAAVQEAANTINLYPASRSPELYQKLADHLNIAPEYLITGNGSDALIYNLGMCLLNPGDEVLIPETTFSVYRNVSRIMQARIVDVPMKGLRIDLQALLSSIGKQTKLVFLCNPNNPTGDTLPPGELVDFLKQVPNSAVIALDEAYIDFVDPALDPHAVEMLKGGMPNLFILRTLSKSYGLAGLRLGYGLGDPEIVRYMHRVKQPFEVSLLAQRAGLAALEDQDFFHHVVRATRREMDYFRRRLGELGLSYVDSQTNFFLIDTGSDGDLVFEELQKLGVIIRPGSVFDLPTHIRVTVGRREENREFFEHLQQALRNINGQKKDE